MLLHYVYLCTESFFICSSHHALTLCLSVYWILLYMFFSSCSYTMFICVLNPSLYVLLIMLLHYVYLCTESFFICSSHHALTLCLSVYWILLYMFFSSCSYTMFICVLNPSLYVLLIMLLHYVYLCTESFFICSSHHALTLCLSVYWILRSCLIVVFAIGSTSTIFTIIFVQLPLLIMYYCRDHVDCVCLCRLIFYGHRSVSRVKIDGTGKIKFVSGLTAVNALSLHRNNSVCWGQQGKGQQTVLSSAP